MGDVSSLGTVMARGQEHLVRSTPDGQRVVKMTVGGRHGYGITPYVRGNDIGLRPGTPAEYLDRLALQNRVFGDGILYEGVTRDSRGEPRIITSQPMVKGERPMAAEISRYMADMGFESVAGQEGNAFYRASDNVAVLDAHEGNLIKTPSGVVSIDVAVVHPDDRLLQILEKGLQGDSPDAALYDDEWKV